MAKMALTDVRVSLDLLEMIRKKMLRHFFMRKIKNQHDICRQFQVPTRGVLLFRDWFNS